MHQLKLVTTVALVGLPIVFPGCGTEFEDCAASRTCAPRAGSAGAAGAGAAGSAGAAGAGAAGSAGAAAAGGSSGTTGGSAGAFGVSGKGGEQAGFGGGGGTSGSTGDAGEGGEGGEGGRPEPAACERDADCDDGLFCNNRETCEDGRCQDAAEPSACENRDVVHCRMRCEEGDGEALCLVEALDEDEDGHSAAQCEAAPGDDCDDENDQIRPNAQEMCDGLDNDCDARVDLDDGLELAGQSAQWNEIRELDLAWVPGEPGIQGDEQFRMVYFSLAGAAGFWSGRLNRSGALDQLTAVHDVGWDPRLAGGTTTFGLAFPSYGRGNFLTLQADPNAAPVLPQATGDSQPIMDIAARAPGEWALGISVESTIRVDVYRDDGSFVTGPLLTFNGQTTLSSPWVRIAAQGNASAVVWQTEPNLLRWARLNASMLATDGERLGTGYRPDIVAAGSGYAMAWAVDSGIAFMRATTGGATLCEKDFVALGLDRASDSHRVALADSELGTLALVTSETGDKVVLVRFGLDCEPSAIIPVANTRKASSPAIAVGNDAVALAWVDKSSSTAYTRVVGERLCN